MSTFEHILCLVLLISMTFVTVLDAKKNYKLEVENIEVIKDASFIIQTEQLRATKHNSSAKVINGVFNFVKDLPLNTILQCTAYPQTGTNTFSLLPLALKPMSFCEDIVKDKKFYPTFLANSNFPKICPLRKGRYWLKNFSLDFKDLPDQLPGDRWKVIVEMASRRRTVGKFNILVYINRSKRT